MPFLKKQSDLSSLCRHEDKYMLSLPMAHILQIRAEGVLHRDPHVQLDGTYWVNSLYFDDSSNTCFRENSAGTDPRSKFRIRYYNTDTSRLSLEKKSKRRGMTHKEVCSLSTEECLCLMRGMYPEITKDMPEDKQRLLFEMQMRGLRPAVIVAYRRLPFVYPAGNVRITFDSQISSSSDIDCFLTGDYALRPVLSADRQILEVKWDEVLPSHIREVMSLDQLQWSAFSKYCMCRINYL